MSHNRVTLGQRQSVGESGLHCQLPTCTRILFDGEVAFYPTVKPGKYALAPGPFCCMMHCQDAADRVRRQRRNRSRREQAQAMRDCGLTRVKGALGGVYWE